MTNSRVCEHGVSIQNIRELLSNFYFFVIGIV